MLLRRDNNRVNHYLEAASEDSDSMRSRASSMDSDWQLSNAFAKIKKPCSKQSIEEENEPVEEENDNGHLESSLSSADETDDESLNVTQVYIQSSRVSVDVYILYIGTDWTGRATTVPSLYKSSTKPATGLSFNYSMHVASHY